MTDNGSKEYYDRRSRRTGNTAYKQNLRGLAIAGGYDVAFLKYMEWLSVAEVLQRLQDGEKVAEPIVEEGQAE